MGKTYERIDGRLRTFIEEQPLFFTASAPLGADGTVNLSPKGLKGSFAILGPLEDKRVAALNRIETAVGRAAAKPEGLEAFAACTLTR